MVSRERNGRLILLVGDFFLLLLTGRGEIKELVFAEIGVFTLQIGGLQDLTSFTHSYHQHVVLSEIAHILSIYHLSLALKNVKIQIS